MPDRRWCLIGVDAQSSIIRHHNSLHSRYIDTIVSLSWKRETELKMTPMIPTNFIDCSWDLFNYRDRPCVLILPSKSELSILKSRIGGKPSVLISTLSALLVSLLSSVLGPEYFSIFICLYFPHLVPLLRFHFYLSVLFHLFSSALCRRYSLFLSTLGRTLPLSRCSFHLLVRFLSDRNGAESQLDPLTSRVEHRALYTSSITQNANLCHRPLWLA